MEETRGVIQNKRRKQQVISFEGIRYRNITPTDIDATLEMGGWMFWFCETKYKDTKMQWGQRKYYEHIVHRLTLGGAIACAFLSYHTVEDPAKDVILKSSNVAEVYWKGRWRDISECVTVGEKLDNFVKYAEQQHSLQCRWESGLQ